MLNCVEAKGIEPLPTPMRTSVSVEPEGTVDATAGTTPRSNAIVARLDSTRANECEPSDDDARQIWRTIDELNIQPDDQTEVHRW